MMWPVTTWWELVIPAAAVISGAAVTGVIQNVNNRNQRKHERILRFVEEKRASYARFLLLFEGLIEIRQDLKIIRDRTDTVKARFESWKERKSALATERADNTQNKTPEEWDSEEDRIQAELDELGKGWQEDDKVLEEGVQKMGMMLSQVNEIYYALRLVATEEVRTAANKMIEIGTEEAAINLGPIRKAMDEFEKAARKDLFGEIT
jgi:hypothetical protein